MRTAVLPALVAVLILAGCGTQAPGGGAATTSPPPNPAAGPVTIKRTGGLAGVNQTIELSPDGSWVYTDGKSNTTQRGSLNDLQRAQVLTLLSAPGFAQDLAAKPTTSGVCNDAFEYTITFGAESFSYTDCGQTEPAVKAVIAAVTEATPF